MRHLVVLVGLLGCSTPPPMESTADAPAHGADGRELDAPTDATNPLKLTCAMTTTTFAPALCPPPPGGDGAATFCYRPQWPGVTAVEVLGDFDGSGTWKVLTTLADQGDGTFRATVALANGSYPYLLRVTGGSDGISARFIRDQLNPNFAAAPAGAPDKRSVSQLIIPQVAAPLRHLRGSVTIAGAPQPCMTVQLDVGDLGGGPGKEHGMANIAEVASDGTFDFPLVDGRALLNIKYPFQLATGYPDGATTPTLGMARSGVTVAGGDVTLGEADMSYPLDAYRALAPSGAASLPVTFRWELVPGAAVSEVAVATTREAGNDPRFTSDYDATTTSLVWDGTFNNGSKAQVGTTYYWGTWQRRTVGETTWTSESLLLPLEL